MSQSLQAWQATIKVRYFIIILVYGNRWNLSPSLLDVRSCIPTESNSKYLHLRLRLLIVLKQYYIFTTLLGKRTYHTRNNGLHIPAGNQDIVLTWTSV